MGQVKFYTQHGRGLTAYSPPPSEPSEARRARRPRPEHGRGHTAVFNDANFAQVTCTRKTLAETENASAKRIFVMLHVGSRAQSSSFNTWCRTEQLRKPNSNSLSAFGTCSDGRWRPSAGEAGFCQGALDDCLSLRCSRRDNQGVFRRGSAETRARTWPHGLPLAAERSEASEAAKTRARTWPHG